MGFVVKDVIAERVLALVRQEEVDLGVTGGEVRDPDVTVLARAADRLHVVYPAGHPIGEVAAVTLEALAEHPLVLMDAATSVRGVVDAAFVAAGRRPVTACEATYMMTAVGWCGPGSASPSCRARPARSGPSPASSRARSPRRAFPAQSA